METAKNFAKLLTNRAMTGEKLINDRAEVATKSSPPQTITPKPVMVILSGPVGMGKSKIHKSTFLPTTHRHLLEMDNITSLVRTLLWYDYMYFKRHIQSLDYNEGCARVRMQSVEIDDTLAVINRTLFDTITYRAMIVFQAYTCDPILFRQKVDNLFKDPKIYDIMHTIRNDLKYTMHNINCGFNLRLIWIMSKAPTNFVGNLKNRVFYHITEINWTRFCLNQMYFFETLVRILDVGDIIYTNKSIDVDAVRKHIRDTVIDCNTF